MSTALRAGWRINPKGGYIHRSSHVVKRARSGKWYWTRGLSPYFFYDTPEEAMIAAEGQAELDTFDSAQLLAELAASVKKPLRPSRVDDEEPDLDTLLAGFDD